MAKIYTKGVWIDEVLAGDEKYLLKNDAGVTVYSEASLELATEVVTAGTAVDAAKMNNIEEGVDAIDDLIVAMKSKVNLDAATELTISGGAITTTQGVHKLQPESGTTDDLDTINGLVTGDVGILYVTDEGVDTITFKHGTGNISCIGGTDVAVSEGSVLAYSDGTLVYLVGGGGGAALEKATGAEIITGTDDAKFATAKALSDARAVLAGWINPIQDWAYASATTITVPAGAAAIYSVGDKIRIKQGAGYKYYYVIVVADALLTVTGGSDFTVANAAITDNYYSKTTSPVGFPQWFLYTASLTGFSGTPTQTCKFSIIGRTLVLRGFITGTSNANTFIVGYPVTTLEAIFVGGFRATDNDGIIIDTVVAGVFGTTSVQFYKDWGATVWTTSGTKAVSFMITLNI